MESNRFSFTFCNDHFAKVRNYCACILILVQFHVYAQEKAPVVRLGLTEVVSIAKQNSTAALRAATVKETRYWQWKTFRSNYRPQLMLNGTLPEFNRNTFQ